jgi:competence protein ComGC
MSKEDLKKELHHLIDTTDDEELLNIVKEDIIAYQTKSNKNFDDLSDLSPEDRAELEELAAEDPDKDTISFEELKKEMNKWVSKL